MRAKILFFDSNPIGRILTRFSKDLTMIDLVLCPLTLLVTQGFMRAVSVVISVSIVNPWLLIPAAIGVVLSYHITKTGLAPMIEAQRFDQLFHGPINQTLSMVTNGLVTFRAYRKFDFFRISFMESIEKSANSTFCYTIANRWIGVRLDVLCVSFGVSAAAFAVFMKDSIDRELLTFSLQIITDIVILFSLSIRLFSEI